MFLKSLNLTNYRNYSNLFFQFKTPITIIIGDNAQGKSNFLESIYFLATTKSLRASEDEELILSNENFLNASAVISNSINEEETHLDINLLKTETGFLAKKVKVNSLARRVVDYIGNFYVVSFSPSDLNLVSGSPSLRRWHIDLSLAQIDRNYKSALTKYGDVITRKNKILKKIKLGEANIDELDYWQNMQIEYGKIVSATRREFFDYLNKSSLPLIDEDSKIEYHYQESVISQDKLNEIRQKEIWNATSLIGPHRDDFNILVINKLNQSRDLKSFGSRGEQRAAMFNLKLAEVEYYHHKTNKRPILILDDIFSELDLVHRQKLVELLPKQQTILALIEIDTKLLESLQQATFVKIQNGQITEISETKTLQK